MDFSVYFLGLNDWAFVCIINMYFLLEVCETSYQIFDADQELGLTADLKGTILKTVLGDGLFLFVGEGRDCAWFIWESAQILPIIQWDVQILPNTTAALQKNGTLRIYLLLKAPMAIKVISKSTSYLKLMYFEVKYIIVLFTNRTNSSNMVKFRFLINNNYV